jgi:hypothetical protein
MGPCVMCADVEGVKQRALEAVGGAVARAYASLAECITSVLVRTHTYINLCNTHRLHG